MALHFALPSHAGADSDSDFDSDDVGVGDGAEEQGAAGRILKHTRAWVRAWRALVSRRTVLARFASQMVFAVFLVVVTKYRRKGRVVLG